MIRPAQPGDAPAVVALVRELAHDERATHEVRLSEQALSDALFREQPAVFCHAQVRFGRIRRSPKWAR